MHGVDWFYAVDLPVHFFAEHPVGSVLGKAKYGDHLLVYQGTTVGGSSKDGKIHYPAIGNNVILFSNASVLGKSDIGSNVIVSAGAQIVNENVPDNCIVFGQTPNLIIKGRNPNIMEKTIDGYWR